MAGKSDTFEQDILKLILNATPIANMADNAATSPLTNLYVALHTADPLTGATEAGTQSTSEISYTGYARVAVARNNASPAWTVSTDGSGNTKAVPTAAIVFGARTDNASAVATHFSIGVASSGATKILYAGTITPNLTIAQGTTPQLTTTTAISED